MSVGFLPQSCGINKIMLGLHFLWGVGGGLSFLRGLHSWELLEGVDKGKKPYDD